MITEVKNLVGWVRSIDGRLKTLNGKVDTHDTDIALLKQWRAAKEKVEDRLESMSRGKFLAILAALLTVAGGILLYLMKRMLG